MRSFANGFFLLFLLYSVTGCSLAVKPDEPEQLPYWVNNHSLTQAVGTSKVNFQGVYTQRAAALNSAKSQLAHNIRSYISSSLQNELRVSNSEISSSFSDKIVALSDVYLSDVRQVDAFFDSQKKLYILVESPKEKIERRLGLASSVKQSTESLPALLARPYEKDELMKSRCYQKEILETISTKSALFQGKPVWFFRPNQGGVLGSVGIAEKEEGMTLREQIRVAYSLAKASFLKEQKMRIESEHELLKIVNEDIQTELFESSTLIKSAAKSTPTEQKDIWLDPKSCELYVWIVGKDEVRN
ncbi:hypothetical protein [Sulfurimonas sp.]|uniref:hypothetical protein n=1 Tax=Sulfurimonas sp. TaxID=2022749 RepID=UPI0026009674|nr:hypothetical protein [Sulfurimonas sp.]MCK9454418.1 hypothetical protein [Sulfurimonas sp.]